MFPNIIQDNTSYTPHEGGGTQVCLWHPLQCQYQTPHILRPLFLMYYIDYTYVWNIPNCTNFSFKHLRHSNVAHRHSGSSRHTGLTSWKFVDSSSKALRQSEHSEYPITGLLFSSDFLHMKQLLITNSGNSILQYLFKKILLGTCDEA